MMGVDPEIAHLHNDMVQRVSHGNMVGLGVTWWPGSSYVSCMITHGDMIWWGLAHDYMYTMSCMVT